MAVFELYENYIEYKCNAASPNIFRQLSFAIFFGFILTVFYNSGKLTHPRNSC